jgi:Ras family protein T1
VCPDFMWDDQLVSVTVETNNKGWITMNGFLAYWSLQTSVDYTYTAQFLAWVGYPLLGRGPLASALTEVRSGQKVKSVYHCQVLGERGGGKSTFVRGLIGREQVVGQGEEEGEEEEEAVTIRSLPVAGSTVYLILHENVYLPDPDDLEEGGGVAEGVAAALGQCDVACFLYDTSDSLSFSSAASLYRAVEASVSEVIPYVFVATKSDRPAVKQVSKTQLKCPSCVEVS